MYNIQLREVLISQNVFKIVLKCIVTCFVHDSLNLKKNFLSSHTNDGVPIFGRR